MPKSNEFFWEQKIKRNKARDISNDYVLQTEGWRVIRNWECEIKKKADREKILGILYRTIVQGSSIYKIMDIPIPFIAEATERNY